METIAKETKTNEEILLQLIQDFFDSRALSQHLLFLEYWMEKLLLNHQHKKYLKASELTFFSDKFLNLLAACNELQGELTENRLYLEESVKIAEHVMSTEQKSIIFYPNYLRKREICNPLLVFSSIFKHYSLDYYIYTLQNWTNASLLTETEPENVRLIFPVYKNLKKMVEACWLIHERSISKNSYQLTATPPNTFNFPSSCPLLLTDEYLINPYLFVESFFSFAGINEYREDIKQWFKAAINEHQCYENASDLLFLHNQFTQLLHAGYLIGRSGLTYQPTHKYSNQYDTFAHWLLARMDNQFTTQTLSPNYKQNPLQYCKENLTLNHIVNLRFGLKEWLEAALSTSTSITSLDHFFIFDQFEELQKILEALFLLIVQPVLAD
ncbi:hypothetical protein WG904_12270 [Pedobacter sp. Du54]|uniref:hypothetical protein n=1 Tax=Pedobacter anseongensis TaxID=3133439 RepID=UPI0030AF5FF4